MNELTGLIKKYCCGFYTSVLNYKAYKLYVFFRKGYFRKMPVHSGGFLNIVFFYIIINFMYVYYKFYVIVLFVQIYLKRVIKN